MDYTYQIHNGQKRINGELCRVDWKVIKALTAIYEILGALRPPVRDQLLESLKGIIDDANATSRFVASIKPPGCDPENPEDDPEYTPPPPAGP